MEELSAESRERLDLGYAAAQYLLEKATKFVEESFPALDPPPTDEDNRLSELMHRQDLTTGGMQFILDLGMLLKSNNDNDKTPGLGI